MQCADFVRTISTDPIDCLIWAFHCASKDVSDLSSLHTHLFFSFESALGSYTSSLTCLAIFVVILQTQPFASLPCFLLSCSYKHKLVTHLSHTLHISSCNSFSVSLHQLCAHSSPLTSPHSVHLTPPLFLPPPPPSPSSCRRLRSEALLSTILYTEALLSTLLYSEALLSTALSYPPNVSH